MILKGFFMILSLSAGDRETLILGIVEELQRKSLALCHFILKKIPEIISFVKFKSKIIIFR